MLIAPDAILQHIQSSLVNKTILKEYRKLLRLKLQNYVESENLQLKLEGMNNQLS